MNQLNVMMYSSLVVVLSLACCCVSGQTGLSASEKQEVLNAHNYFRTRVNPIATNMEKMVRLYIYISDVASHKTECS